MSVQICISPAIHILWLSKCFSSYLCITCPRVHICEWWTFLQFTFWLEVFKSRPWEDSMFEVNHFQYTSVFSQKAKSKDKRRKLWRDILKRDNYQWCPNLQCRFIREALKRSTQPAHWNRFVLARKLPLSDVTWLRWDPEHRPKPYLGATLKTKQNYQTAAATTKTLHLFGCQGNEAPPSCAGLTH